MPVRVLDTDGTSNGFMVAEAVLDAVASGASVINMSFGTDHKLESKVLKEAIKVATKSGVVVVAAAGNDGTSLPHYPAAIDDVVGVGALSTRPPSASFSARGDSVDLATIGVDLTGPIPGGGYAQWSGTSMAAPIVAAQFALLRARNPSASLTKILKWAQDSASKISKVRWGRADLLASLGRA